MIDTPVNAYPYPIGDSYICHMATVERMDDLTLENLRQRVRLRRLKLAGSSHQCGWCSTIFYGRAGALYCSGRCRTAHYRAKLG
jgi:hypothetical protein